MARIWYLFKQCCLDAWASVLLLWQRLRYRKGEKIKVGFLCQYIQAWNKCLPVYEQLKANPAFEVFLLCVPNQEGPENDTYKYFTEQGYEAINAVTGPGSWVDIKSLKPDYLFYTRPYNSFMPPEYHSGRVCRYTRICVLLYAMLLTKDAANTSLNRDFFRHVYCYFAETECSRETNRKHYPISHRLGIRKSVCYGMPAMEQIKKIQPKDSVSWGFSKNPFRVFWTPRWTTDPAHGGTNFFLYKDVLPEYAKEHGEMDFLFRPHPLAFDNFVKIGKMTEEEVVSYKKMIEEEPNLSLDTEKEYVDTMWQSDVLISDLSGMMPEYFVTGKPIIYCSTNMILQPTEHFAEMIKGCYSVESPEELFGVLEMLQRGEDPLAKERKEILKRVFGEHLDHASQSIVKELQRE